MSHDELYAIIDEVLHQRYEPHANAGSEWIEFMRDDDPQLRIGALADALWAKIVNHLEVTK